MLPLLILFRFLWAPFGRQRPSGGKSNLFSRRQRVSFILQKHIFLLKIQQKTPSMSQKGHRGREQTRGTTSIYRLRGLIGYKHTRSAVLGAPSAAYHPPGLRGAAPDGNWMLSLSCLAPPGSSLKKRATAPYCMSFIAVSCIAITLSLLTAAVNARIKQDIPSPPSKIRRNAKAFSPSSVQQQSRPKGGFAVVIEEK